MTHDDVLSDAKKYELMVIINSDLGEEAIKKRLESLRKQITAFPGEIIHEEIWGLRDLAYPIKKHEQGYYAVVDFMADPSKIKEFDATLRLENEVLRHLIMVLPATYEPKDYTVVEEKPMEETPGESKKVPERKAEKSAPGPAKAAASKVKEEEPVPAKEKKSKQTMENVDAKLQSILENPDLNF